MRTDFAGVVSRFLDKAERAGVRHVTYLSAMIGSGVPAEYGEVLRALTETIASGHGSRPNGDVLAVTGTRPVSFAEFAAETASAWKEK